MIDKGIILKGINIKEFKKQLYRQYKELFPPEERKPFFTIKRTAKKGITTILKIEKEGKTIGFFILNSINNYMQIDYFAIFKEYQSNGYGTIALQELKNMYSNNNGIFIEIEKCGLGVNDEENKIREKRLKFYKNLEFEQIDFDLLLYGVIYTPLCFNYKNKEDASLTKNILFDFYYSVYKKKIVDKNCKAIDQDMEGK